MNKISDYIESIIDNRGKNPSYYSEDGKYLVLDNFLINGERHPSSNDVKRRIDEHIYETFIRKYANKNDLAITLVGNGCGKCCLIPSDTWVIIQNTIGLKPKKNLDTRYLYYYLTLNRQRVVKLDGGSSQPNVRVDNFLSLDVNFPELSTQVRIADVLSVIDDKIEINNRINTELEAIAKLIYDYWFVQFDFPDDNGKPYKSSGGKMVYNEVLKRDVPLGWRAVKLIKEVDVQYGYPFSTKMFNETGMGNPIVRIRNIMENSVDMYSTESVDDKYLLKKGDLLIGMDGNFHLNFWDKDDCYLNQRCVRVRKNKDSRVSHLQVKFEIEPHIKAREKNVSRTTVGHLSAKDIDALNVLVPSSENVLSLRECFDNILRKIITNRNENQTLSKLRDWLLPMLMNGQVTIKEGLYSQSNKRKLKNGSTIL